MFRKLEQAHTGPFHLVSILYSQMYYLCLSCPQYFAPLPPTLIVPLEILIHR